LIQKIERQPTESTSTPPTTGPSAIENPTTAAHTPIAWARSLGSVNVFVIMDIATGFSMDPPSACSMRKMIRPVKSGARLHSSEPVMKMIRPVTNVRRRPSRSAVEPDNIKKLASTRV
jgi:hypothetical protein